MAQRRRCRTVPLLATYALLWPVASHAEFAVQRIASGLNQPVYMTQAPGDDTNLYIVERAGTGSTLGDILKFNPVTHTSSTFLNLPGTLTQDGGVLGLAFHPDYASNGLFYVSSLVGAVDHLDEYKLVGGTPTFQRAILQYNSPATQHTINWIGFKPNAVGSERNQLYVTTGDGGIQADSSNGTFRNNGQDPTTDLGKVLRLDVNPLATDAYPSDPNKNFAIPANNPFVADNTGKLKEIFETGHRNPYRASFDRATGDLYVGDVGFNTKEEIDFNKNDAGFNTGRDYGWAKREGTIATPVNGVGGTSPGSLNPIFEINHPTFSSITGGYVYRGPIPELQGKYLFADFVHNKLMALTFDRNTDPSTFNGANAGITGVTDLTATLDGMISGGSLNAIVSFGEDNAGNLYIVDFTDPAGGNIFNPALGHGEIYKLSAVPEPGVVAIPLLAVAGVGLGRRRKNRI